MRASACASPAIGDGAKERPRLRAGRRGDRGMTTGYDPDHLVRTLGPGLHPSLDERARLLLRAGRRLPAISGRPSPTDQVIFADMLNERVHRTVSVARWILDLEANLAERLAFPSHFTRGEMPDRIARHAGGVVVGLQVADRTAHRREAKTVSAALDRSL